MRQDQVDPETLAALLDGTLPAGERDEVMERLARSSDGFEAFAEVARILRDLDADVDSAPAQPADAPSAQPADAPPARPDAVPVAPPPPPSMREIRPARRFPGAKLWLPLAAVLAAAILVPRLINRGTGAPGSPIGLLDGGTLVPSPGDGSLAAALEPGWDQPWPVSRGNGTVPLEEREEFRAGVRLAEVEAALDAGDTQAARQFLLDLKPLLAQAEVAGSLVMEYEAIVMRTDEPDRALEKERTRAAAAIARNFQNAPWFDLGVWIEQARLATLAKQTAFFDERAARVLEGLIARVEKEPGAGESVAQQLRQLHGLIRDGTTSTDEIEPIRALLASVMRKSGG